MFVLYGFLITTIPLLIVGMVVRWKYKQNSDQATSGRFDGENMQVGWTDVCDTPYWETIEAVREIGSRLYEIRAGGARVQ